MPGWLTSMLRDTEINLATYPGYSFETTLALLAEFDRNVREARAALANVREARAALAAADFGRPGCDLPALDCYDRGGGHYRRSEVTGGRL
jgi:hypothetical protein